MWAVVLKEIRQLSRRPLAYVLVVTALLSEFLLALFATETDEAGPYVDAAWLFRATCILELIFLAVVFYILLPMAAAEEQRRGTWELLILTPLSPFEIAIGKLVSRLLVGLAPVAALASVGTFVGVAGGASATEIIRFHVTVAVVVFYFTSAMFLFGVAVTGYSTYALRGVAFPVQWWIYVCLTRALRWVDVLDPAAVLTRRVSWLLLGMPDWCVLLGVALNAEAFDHMVAIAGRFPFYGGLILHLLLGAYFFRLVALYGFPEGAELGQHGLHGGLKPETLARAERYADDPSLRRPAPVRVRFADWLERRWNLPPQVRWTILMNPYDRQEYGGMVFLALAVTCGIGIAVGAAVGGEAAKPVLIVVLSVCGPMLCAVVIAAGLTGWPGAALGAITGISAVGAVYLVASPAKTDSAITLCMPPLVVLVLPAAIVGAHRERDRRLLELVAATLAGPEAAARGQLFSALWAAGPFFGALVAAWLTHLVAQPLVYALVGGEAVRINPLMPVMLVDIVVWASVFVCMAASYGVAAPSAGVGLFMLMTGLAFWGTCALALAVLPFWAAAGGTALAAGLLALVSFGRVQSPWRAWCAVTGPTGVAGSLSLVVLRLLFGEPAGPALEYWPLQPYHTMMLSNVWIILAMAFIVRPALLALCVWQHVRLVKRVIRS